MTNVWTICGRQNISNVFWTIFLASFDVVLDRIREISESYTTSHDGSKDTEGLAMVRTFKHFSTDQLSMLSTIGRLAD